MYWSDREFLAAAAAVHLLLPDGPAAAADYTVAAAVINEARRGFDHDTRPSVVKRGAIICAVKM